MLHTSSLQGTTTSYQLINVVMTVYNVSLYPHKQ